MKSMKKEKGMALLEVLIAMLVFALALVPLIRLQVLSMDATRAGFYKTETAAAAESMMDYLMTDVGAIFHDKWKEVVVTSGEKCSAEGSVQRKIACEILNPHNAKSHADGNAVLCIFGERPQYSVPTRSDPDSAKTSNPVNMKNRDQYLISIRAVWYSGKRDERENYYDKDLSKEACGDNYRSEMNQAILANENIDYIKINMAY